VKKGGEWIRIVNGLSKKEANDEKDLC
jgi:hypothetical protein